VDCSGLALYICGMVIPLIVGLPPFSLGMGKDDAFPNAVSSPDSRYLAAFQILPLSARNSS
jgi:hypothetical protein